MTCTNCQAPVGVVTHRFYVGDPRRPVEEWTILAPLYFAATPDFRSGRAAFCGVACSTAWHRANRGTA